MSSVEKRSENKYRITVSCGYDSNGKKIRKHKTIILPDGLTERQRDKEINRQAVLFEQSVQDGTFLDGEKITLAEFIDTWLTDYAEKKLAPATLHVYKMRIEKRIIPALGHIKLSKLQPHHLLEFYNNLAEEGVRLDAVYKPTDEFIYLLSANDRKGLAAEMGVSRSTLKRLIDGNPTNEDTAKKVCSHFNYDFKKAFAPTSENNRLSDTTVSHHHKLLSSILTAAVQWQIIDSNPAQRIKPPEAKRKKANSYDDNQILQLFEALENAPLKYKTLIYLVVYSGIRLSEAAGLTWENTDFENSTITIDKQRMYVANYGTFEKSTKTESGVRVISLPSVVMNLLKQYQHDCILQRLQVGDLWEGSEPGRGNIFLGDMGKPMFPLRPSKWFNEFLKKNNCQSLNFTGLDTLMQAF